MDSPKILIGERMSFIFQNFPVMKAASLTSVFGSDRVLISLDILIVILIQHPVYQHWSSTAAKRLSSLIIHKEEVPLSSSSTEYHPLGPCQRSKLSVVPVHPLNSDFATSPLMTTCLPSSGVSCIAWAWIQELSKNSEINVAVCDQVSI